MASLVAVVALAALHVAAPAHARWRSEPRFWLLTFASGAAVAFVLIRLLPSVLSDAAAIGRPVGLSGDDAIRLALSLTLMSVVGFFALDRLVKRSRRERSHGSLAREAGPSAFALALVVYAGLNTGVGYLVHEQGERGYAPLVLLVVAKALAFLVLDHAFLEDQGERYARAGRWLVAAGDIVGWVFALLVTLPRPATVLFLAVLGGGILFNALKEEISPRHRARAWPFTLGASTYAALVWALA